MQQKTVGPLIFVVGGQKNDSQTHKRSKMTTHSITLCGRCRINIFLSLYSKAVTCISKRTKLVILTILIENENNNNHYNNNTKKPVVGAQENLICYELKFIHITVI